MNKKQIAGIIIFVVIILGVVAFKLLKGGSEGGSILDSNLTTIYVATGGG